MVTWYTPGTFFPLLPTMFSASPFSFPLPPLLSLRPLLLVKPAVSADANFETGELYPGKAARDARISKREAFPDG